MNVCVLCLVDGRPKFHSTAFDICRHRVLCPAICAATSRRISMRISSRYWAHYCCKNNQSDVFHKPFVNDGKLLMRQVIFWWV